jgi:alkylated DNA repair dioxygenase AlkB
MRVKKRMATESKDGPMAKQSRNCASSSSPSSSSLLSASASSSLLVPGLQLVTGVLTESEESKILSGLAVEPGHGVVQVHPATEFGWRFLKRKSGIYSISPLSAEDYLGPWPIWLRTAWEKCVACCLDANKLPTAACDRALPDHALVNTYAVGDGCIAHVDDLTFWTDWVIGLSLGSGCNIEFTPIVERKVGTNDAASIAVSNVPVVVHIPARSAYILTGDARYRFTHSIPFVAADTVDGHKIERTKRTSITFRNISQSMLPDSLRNASSIS